MSELTEFLERALLTARVRMDNELAVHYSLMGTDLDETMFWIDYFEKALKATEPPDPDGWYDVWETRNTVPPFEWTRLTSLGTKQVADDFVLSRMTNNCLTRWVAYYRILPAGSPPPGNEVSE